MCIFIDIYSFMKDDNLFDLDTDNYWWNNHRGDMNEAFHGGKIRCYVHIMKEGLCYRVNTLGQYIEANRQVRQKMAFNTGQEHLCTCLFGQFCDFSWLVKGEGMYTHTGMLFYGHRCTNPDNCFISSSWGQRNNQTEILRTEVQ